MLKRQVMIVQWVPALMILKNTITRNDKVRSVAVRKNSSEIRTS
jgi:hypothetical protein